VEEKTNCRGLGGGTTGRVPLRWRSCCLAARVPGKATHRLFPSRNHELRRFSGCRFLVRYTIISSSSVIRFSSSLSIGAAAAKLFRSSALARIISVMAESLTLHEPPGGALTAEKTVHISIPQRRRPSRPHYLDWILHHQIGTSPPEAG
jgi:hypothetical protein